MAKDLITVRTNIFYRKTEGEYEKYYEIIFICQDPQYELSNDLSVQRSRGLEDLRMTVAHENIDTVIEALEELKSLESDDLE